MDEKPKHPLRLPAFLENPGYWLGRISGEIYSRWQENFNSQWRQVLPPIPCQFCGQTDHKEAYCPNLRKMGFIENNVVSDAKSNSQFLSRTTWKRKKGGNVPENSTQSSGKRCKLNYCQSIL
jgi:hypothetical protein